MKFPTTNKQVYFALKEIVEYILLYNKSKMWYKETWAPNQWQVIQYNYLLSIPCFVFYFIFSELQKDNIRSEGLLVWLKV